MEKEEICHKLLEGFTKEEILKDEPMSKHTSFKIGGMADFYIVAKKIEDIKFIINLTKNNNIPLTIIGNGTNILVTDKGIRGIVLRIGLNGIEKINKGETTDIIVQSGVMLSKVSMLAAENSLTGMEFAYGIPGTLGGAIRMNAGAYGGEMKDVIVLSTYIDENLEIKTINNEEHEFAYRNSIFSKNNYIILSSIISLKKGNKEEIQEKMDEILKARKEKQPLKFPSAGSTFKRGDNFITAKLIDECGLKGYKIGGAMVSDLHAGFVVNTGNATAEDVINLTEYVKQKVKEKFNEDIELEIIPIGEK